MAKEAESSSIHIELHKIQENDDNLKHDSSSTTNGFSFTANYSRIMISCIAFLTFLIFGGTAAMLGPALPALSRHFHISISQMGSSFVARGIGFGIGTGIAAWLLNQTDLSVSRETLTVGSLGLSSITIAFIGLSSSFEFAMFSYVLQGIAFGGIDTIANVLLPELWGKQVQPWLQALHFCFGLGSIISPAMIGLGGYKLTFFIVFVGGFIPICALSAFKCAPGNNVLLEHESKKKQRSNHSNHEEILSVVDGDSDNIGTSTPELALIPQDEENYDDNENSGGGHGDGGVIPAPALLKFFVSLFYFVYVGSETAFAGWIPSYSLLTGITNSEAQASYLTSVFWATLTLGRLIGVFAALLFTAQQMIRAELMLCIIAVIVMMLFMQSYALATCISALLGLAYSATFPVMLSLIGEYGFRLDGSTTTVFIVGASLGEAVVPVLVGSSMDLFGPEGMRWCIFISVLSFSALYLIIDRISITTVRKFNITGTYTGVSSWGDNDSDGTVNAIHDNIGSRCDDTQMNSRSQKSTDEKNGSVELSNFQETV